ncbi:hypothetical protein JCM11251_002915 [Rhodosporidiobolus azoricus]
MTFGPPPLRTFLRLSPSGRWVLSSLPYNRQRYPRLPPAPPQPPKTSFPTLASDATPVPSLQASAPSGGVREAVSEAGAVGIPPNGAEAAKKAAKRSFLSVDLPVKPSPPEEGECCMSGCAHCVYDLYLEDLELYHSLLSSAKSTILIRLASLHDRGQALEEVEKRDWPEELGKKEEVLAEVARGGSGRKGGVGEEQEAKQKAQKELEKAREGLDPTMRAFLEMEAKMKAKQQAKAS